MKLWHFSTQDTSAGFRRCIAAFCCLFAVICCHTALAADAPNPRALIHQGDSTAEITDKLGPALAVIQNGSSIYLTYPEGRIVIQNDHATLIPLALLSTAPVRAQPPLSGAPAMTGAANSPLPPAPVSAAAIPVVSVAPAAPAPGGLAGVVGNARQKVIENNLRQISNAADQYMADKKVAQVTYKQITTGPDAMNIKVTPASGESYDALVIHKDAAISVNVPGIGLVTYNTDGSTTVTAAPAAGAKPLAATGNATAAAPRAKPPAPPPEETGQTLLGYPLWMFEAAGLLIVVLGAVLFLKGKKSKKPAPAKDEKTAAPGAPAAPAKPGAPPATAGATAAAAPKPTAHATSKPIPLRTKAAEPPPPPAAPPPKPSSSTSAGSMGAEPPMTAPPMPVPPPTPPPPPPPPPSTPKLVMPSRAATTPSTPAPTPAAPASTPAPAPATEPPKPAELPKAEPPKPAETPSPTPRLGLKLPSKPPTPPPGA